MQIILASKSPYRKAQLESLGFAITVVPSKVDEDQLKTLELPPSKLAEKLAVLKAQAVADQFPDALVIGSDQVAALPDEILGKPGSEDKNIQTLVKLQGQTHELITAVAVIYRDQSVSFANTTRLTMRPLTREQIIAYVKKDQPLQCAGGYKIEGSGICLFENIQTDDFSAIIGLPLIQLTSEILKITGKLPFETIKESEDV